MYKASGVNTETYGLMRWEQVLNGRLIVSQLLLSSGESFSERVKDALGFFPDGVCVHI